MAVPHRLKMKQYFRKGFLDLNIRVSFLDFDVPVLFELVFVILPDVFMVLHLWFHLLNLLLSIINSTFFVLGLNGALVCCLNPRHSALPAVTILLVNETFELNILSLRRKPVLTEEENLQRLWRLQLVLLPTFGATISCLTVQPLRTEQWRKILISVVPPYVANRVSCPQ